MTASKRIMIIGGAGFIGHNLALSLKALGHDVCVVDGLSVNSLLFFENTENLVENRELYIGFINHRLKMLREAGIPVHIEDARDYFRLSMLIRKKESQIVIHLAAVAHADRSNKDPYNTFDHSLRTLENALDSSKRTVEHFIYFSSSMIYGNFISGTVTENTPCEPLGIYGALKLAGEKMVIAYQQVFGLPYTIIRPSALYGEGCVSRRVIQIFIENAMMGKDISIKGSGDNRLDFTYIGDLVHGIEQVISRPEAKNQIFNITYGASRTIGELAEIVSKHFPKIKVHYEPKDELMPERGTLSVEKAKELIGYDPHFPLEKGIARYIDWYKSK